jgi:hypothetical protein
MTFSRTFAAFWLSWLRIHFLFTVENLGNESAMKLAGARLSRSFTRLRCRLRVSQAVGD